LEIERESNRDAREQKANSKLYQRGSRRDSEDKKLAYLRYMNDVMIKKTKELLTIYYNLLKISKNPIVAIIIIIPFIFGGTGVGI
jgi:hypothetical protein